MAEENAQPAEGGGGSSDSEEGGPPGPPVKCPECVPGLPGWMATFSDMVTLLLTFFVLLLSFAKTETAKYEAALGSIRNAFGGNVLKQGKVLQLGKSPDDAPSMLEALQTAKPFPIDFLTMEGLLDRHEINRESAEDLREMRSVIKSYDLSDSTTFYEMPEGIKVRVKDMIFFKEGSTKISSISVEIFQRLLNLMKSKDWKIFVEGHAALGETSNKLDAFTISSTRALAVTRTLIKMGVGAGKIVTISYGDTRPNIAKESQEQKRFRKKDRRVEFMLRKIDYRSEGKKVDSR